MTVQKLKLIFYSSSILGLILFVFLCYSIINQTIIINELNSKKNIIKNDLSKIKEAEEKSEAELFYLNNNYNLFLDDMAKDYLGMIQANQEKIISDET